MARKYNKAQLEYIWIAGGGNPSDAPLMAAISQAESSGEPTASNPSGAEGLWQIKGQLVSGNIFNPYINAENAVAKLKGQGLAAWTTYTEGTYKAYLGPSELSSKQREEAGLRYAANHSEAEGLGSLLGRSISEAVPDLKGIPGGAIGEGVEKGVEGLKHAVGYAESLGNFLNFITQKNGIDRIIKVGIGSVIMILSIKTLTAAGPGPTVDVVGTTKKAAGTATKAAETAAGAAAVA